MNSINIHLRNNKPDVVLFDVDISTDVARTQHIVSVNKEDYQRLTARKISSKELVKRAIEFLLERENNDAMLQEFNLMDIPQFFPEFEETVQLT